MAGGVKFDSLDDFKRMARAVRAVEAMPRDQSAAPNAARTVFPTNVYYTCQVKVDGGVAGSMASGTTCTFTYSLFDLNGNAIKDAAGTPITGKTPDAPRYASCAYDRPADNSPGVYYRDSTGAIHLLWAVKEKPTGATISLSSTVGFNSGSGAWWYKTTPVLVLDKGTEGSEIDYVSGAGCP